MEITVNGRFRFLPAGMNLFKLLECLELDSDRVAVEHNGLILQRDLFSTTPLSDGDRLEIIQFVGGG